MRVFRRRVPHGRRATLPCLLLGWALVCPVGPVLAACGDSVLDPGEECEVGPNGDAACQEACVPPTLADGCRCALPPADPQSYVALAELKLRAGPGLQVTSGNVGVWATGGFLLIGGGGRVASGSQTVGDRVRLQDLVQVDRLFSNSAAQIAGASIANGGPFRFDVPLMLAPPLPALATGTPGPTTYTVADGGSAVLGPGGYGAVVVGRDATLVLQGLSPGSGAGRYDVASLTLYFGARLVVENPVDVRVSDRLLMFPTSTLGPSPTANALAGDVRVDVAGFLVRLAHSTTVRARLRAARLIGIGRGVSLAGQLIAPRIKAAPDVALTLQGSCGDGRLEGGEACDASAPVGGDLACPGLCVPAGSPGQCTCS